MTLTSEEQAVVKAFSRLSVQHQNAVAKLFGARAFDISLLTGPSERERLRDWVESTINAASGTDLPPGVAGLRGAVRQLRVAFGDTRDS